MLVKSVFFYILVNMEAFTICFLGEYLSTKVSKYDTCIGYMTCFIMKLILEQNDW